MEPRLKWNEIALAAKIILLGRRQHRSYYTLCLKKTSHLYNLL